MTAGQVLAMALQNNENAQVRKIYWTFNIIIQYSISNIRLFGYSGVELDSQIHYVFLSY